MSGAGTMLDKIWLCESCGDVYELAAHALPPRDELGRVLCVSCDLLRDHDENP